MKLVALAALAWAAPAAGAATCAAGDGSCAAAFAACAATFARDGYCVLRGLLTEAEVASLEPRFDAATRPDAAVAARMGRDHGDHSEGLINANNPGRYVAGFSPNVFVDRAAAGAAALLGARAAVDYEQLLLKPPRAGAAEFPWHQDMQYWPKRSGAPTATATFSLALTDADAANGCLRVVPGSGAPKALVADRAPAPNNGTRAIVLPLTAAERAAAVDLPVKRGDVTVHDEWVVHGSGGNPSDRERKTSPRPRLFFFWWARGGLVVCRYVVAFRDAAAVAYERSVGFSHSYNDDAETLRRVRAGEL